MSVQVAHATRPDGCVLMVAGRVDGSTSAAVRSKLDAAIDGTRGDVVVDLSTAEWCDLTGLAVLASAHRRMMRQERRLVLRGCSPRVRRALALSGLTRVIDVEPEKPGTAA